MKYKKKTKKKKLDLFWIALEQQQEFCRQWPWWFCGGMHILGHPISSLKHDAMNPWLHASECYGEIAIFGAGMLP
jgi:hypothetical protein